MKIKTKKRRAVATFSIVAIAALMIASVAAYNLADAAPPDKGDKEGGGPANKTMIGIPDLSVQPNTNGWQPIISGMIKTSSTSDLVVTHFQECAIHTGLKLDEQFSSATSVVREDIRLVIDGQIIPASFGDPVTPPFDSDEDGIPDNKAKLTEGIVTMCGRAYQMETNILEKINALCNTVVDPVTGLAVCEANSFLNSFIATKQTHGWQWVALNVGSGDHKVVIEARTATVLDNLVAGTGVWEDAASDLGSCKKDNVEGVCVDTVLEVGKRQLIAVEDKLAVSASLS